MKELKQLRLSRCAHRSHLTKTLTSITEALDRDSSELLTELQVISIKTMLEGLQRQGILTNIDGKIALLIKDKDELETEVYECEDL